MENKALYVLAGYDKKTDEILSEIQHKLYDLGFSGVQTKNIPMHFTMGKYDTSKKEELKSRLENIAETLNAFTVSFNHIGIFRLPQNDVLFAAPEVSREMLQLKDCFLDSMDQYNWSPHTTLLIDKPDIIQEAIPTVLNGFKSLNGKVEILHLYEFWPAKHILSVDLRKKDCD